MTHYVLDTNIVSFVGRGDLAIESRLWGVSIPGNTLLRCPVVWFEARRGLLYRDAKMQMRKLNDLFDTFEWQDYTREDWSLAADWWALRRAAGQPIADADLLIAVFAHNRDAALVTDNEKDFADLGVNVENWRQP